MAMKTLQENIDRLVALAASETRKATQAAAGRDHLLRIGELAAAETQQKAVEMATATAARFDALACRLVHLASQA